MLFARPSDLVTRHYFMEAAPKSRSRRAEIRKNRPDTLRLDWQELKASGATTSVGIVVGFFVIAYGILLLRQDVIPYRPDQPLTHDIVSRVAFAYPDRNRLIAEQDRRKWLEPRVYAPSETAGQDRVAPAGEGAADPRRPGCCRPDPARGHPANLRRPRLAYRPQADRLRRRTPGLRGVGARIRRRAAELRDRRVPPPADRAAGRRAEGGGPRRPQHPHRAGHLRPRADLRPGRRRERCGRRCWTRWRRSSSRRRTRSARRWSSTRCRCWSRRTGSTWRRPPAGGTRPPRRCPYSAGLRHFQPNEILVHATRDGAAAS